MPVLLSTGGTVCCVVLPPSLGGSKLAAFGDGNGHLRLVVCVRLDLLNFPQLWWRRVGATARRSGVSVNVYASAAQLSPPLSLFFHDAP